MASPNDNFSVKDSNAIAFKIRGKDISTLQDGSLQMPRHLNTPYPVDYGFGGCFQLCSKSGVMAAGLAAASPIYSFRWTSITLLAIIRRVRFQAWALGTAFTPGVALFDMIICRGWSAADTGGVTDVISGDNGGLRTIMPVPQVQEIRHSSTAALVAGTRTKDAQPVDSVTFGISGTANTTFSPDRINLFQRLQAEHPLVLAANEGFTIQATVPATGIWSFLVVPEWDEVPLNNY